jgi:hypothetical protein
MPLKPPHSAPGASFGSGFPRKTAILQANQHQAQSFDGLTLPPNVRRETTYSYPVKWKASRRHPLREASGTELLAEGHDGAAAIPSRLFTGYIGMIEAKLPTSSHSEEECVKKPRANAGLLLFTARRAAACGW